MRTHKISSSTSWSDYVSLNEVKEFLRVEHAAEDVLISSLIAAAFDECESYLGLDLTKKVYEYQVDWMPRSFDIYNAPLIGVDSIKFKYGEWIDSTSVDGVSEFDGAIIRDEVNNGSPVERTLSSNNYRVFEYEYGAKITIIISDEKVADLYDVKLTYQAGFEPADLPAIVKSALFLKVASLYDTREDVNSRFKKQSNALLDHYKNTHV